jgi:hypothetical protein
VKIEKIETDSQAGSDRNNQRENERVSIITSDDDLCDE